MVTYWQRQAWAGAGPVRALTPLARPGPVGVAVHWPGAQIRYGPRPTLTQTARHLETIREFHTMPPPRGRGWSDIAYQVAVDQAGRCLDLRGIGHRPAANGTRALNTAWGAALFLVGPGEDPTPDLLAAFADWQETRWLTRWPAATRVTGHGLIHGTDCPGPAVRRLIETGRILPAVTPTGGDMTVDLSVTSVRAVAEACTGAMAEHPVEIPTVLDGQVRPDRVIGQREFLAPSTALGVALRLLAEQAQEIAGLRDDVRALTAAVRAVSR